MDQLLRQVYQQAPEDRSVNRVPAGETETLWFQTKQVIIWPWPVHYVLQFVTNQQGNQAENHNQCIGGSAKNH